MARDALPQPQQTTAHQHHFQNVHFIAACTGTKFQSITLTVTAPKSSTPISRAQKLLDHRLELQGGFRCHHSSTPGLWLLQMFSLPGHYSHAPHTHPIFQAIPPPKPGHLYPILRFQSRSQPPSRNLPRKQTWMPPSTYSYSTPGFTPTTPCVIVTSLRSPALDRQCPKLSGLKGDLANG